MKLFRIIFFFLLIRSFGSTPMNAQVSFIERGLTIGEVLKSSPKNYLNIHGSKGLFFSDGAKHVKINVESSDPAISSSNKVSAKEIILGKGTVIEENAIVEFNVL